MMSCQEYIFKLTSGQLTEANWRDRFWSAQHRMVCRNCRAFTANDERLDQILAGYKQQLTEPEEPAGHP